MQSTFFNDTFLYNIYVHVPVYVHELYGRINECADQDLNSCLQNFQSGALPTKLSYLELAIKQVKLHTPPFFKGTFHSKIIISSSFPTEAGISMLCLRLKIVQFLKLLTIIRGSVQCEKIRNKSRQDTVCLRLLFLSFNKNTHQIPVSGVQWKTTQGENPRFLIMEM